MACDSMDMLPMAPLQQDLGADVISLATPPVTCGKIRPGDSSNYGAAAGDEGSFAMHAGDGRERAGASHGVPASADKEASAAAAEAFLPGAA